MELYRAGTLIKTAGASLPNISRSVETTHYISLSNYFGTNIIEDDVVRITSAQNIENFFYITNGAVVEDDKTQIVVNTQPIKVNEESGYKEFRIASITKDVIYVEDKSLLEAKGYYDVQKYYLIKLDLEEESYYYRTSRTYSVTGTNFNLYKNYSDEICFVFNEGVTNSTITSVVFADWSSAFKLYNAVVSNNTIQNSQVETALPDLDGDRLSCLRFYILDEGNAAIGRAEIDDKTGKITFKSSLQKNEYIKVQIKMIVSGNDRTLGTEDDTQLELGVLNLGVKVISN